MTYLNIIAEGSSEENFVNQVIVAHFATSGIYVSVRRIKTGWDKKGKKPAKGGLLRYGLFRNDILNWIKSDNQKANTWYTSFVDLYAFPKDSSSPYTDKISKITDPYQKIKVLEEAIAKDIAHPNFIPYVQLHEFETFLLVDVNELKMMYPDKEREIDKLKKNVGTAEPEEINESPQTAPSKRIIKYIPEYENSKAQVGPLTAKEIGMEKLRSKCRHFDEWITKLSRLSTIQK
ncbi:MAG: hypothetical protein BWK79_10655 [Beggiatoa sp. IS2]|nr:MAG: hypothetical protein BWK79_10655 [Beggiatoa sp. IS2]